MLAWIESVNKAVNNFIWGVPAMILLMGVGLYLSVGTGFVQLRKFGAAVTFSGRQARLDGVSALHGANVRAEDLRGGAALVIAALCADGASHIAGVKHILRGYDNLAGKLQILGGDIKYVEIPDKMLYNTQ